MALHLRNHPCIDSFTHKLYCWLLVTAIFNNINELKAHNFCLLVIAMMEKLVGETLKFE